MTRTEMLDSMKRLDAHANALLLTGASLANEGLRAGHAIDRGRSVA